MTTPAPNARRLPPRQAQARAIAKRSGPVAVSLVDPRRLERSTVRKVACPRCGAPAGSPCSTRRGPRRSHHLERVTLASTDRAPR